MQSSFKIDLERFILRRDRGAHKVISTNDESDLNQPTNLLKRELRAAQFEIDLFIQSFFGVSARPFYLLCIKTVSVPAFMITYAHARRIASSTFKLANNASIRDYKTCFFWPHCSCHGIG